MVIQFGLNMARLGTWRKMDALSRGSRESQFRFRSISMKTCPVYLDIYENSQIKVNRTWSRFLSLVLRDLTKWYLVSVLQKRSGFKIHCQDTWCGLTPQGTWLRLTRYFWEREILYVTKMPMDINFPVIVSKCSPWSSHVFCKRTFDVNRNNVWYGTKSKLELWPLWRTSFVFVFYRKV